MFIVIFLSIPLLLIYLANGDYENSNSFNDTTARGFIGQGHTLEIETNSSSSMTDSNISSLSIASDSTPQDPISRLANHKSNNPFNCTEYALQANLSLADDNGKLTQES